MKTPRLAYLLLATFFCLSTIAPALLVSSPAMAQSAAKEKNVKAKKTVKPTAKKTRTRVRANAVQADDRSAALVIDANTGRTLYASNAEALRHPASLTKMMTLYLTFEALRSGKITMNTSIPVSAKAASQPATNLNMSPGMTIPVRTAIQALIIRSANDVAMAMAEALGGTQWDFALMMNQKARQLGMNSTVFYNPSGLPDSRQVTTARDLAKLGVALRRDFPEYYDYFKQTQFSFNGRVYPGHNRLLGRYPGADGIKTGFVNASGFNLVTSVKRGSTSLIGVVMGGRTGASRDQEMMSMLDRVFLQLAGEQTDTKAVPALASLKRKLPKEATITPQDLSKTEQPVATATPSSRREEKEEAEAPAPARLSQAQKQWAVQVGTYPTQKQARSSAEETRKLSDNLKSAQVSVSSYRSKGKRYWRARLTNLTAEEAKNACGELNNQNKQCLMVKTGK